MQVQVIDSLQVNHRGHRERTQSTQRDLKIKQNPGLQDLCDFCVCLLLSVVFYIFMKTGVHRIV